MYRSAENAFADLDFTGLGYVTEKAFLESNLVKNRIPYTEEEIKSFFKEYNLFGKNPKQMRKLKKMREDDAIKNLLATKFDREILVQLLGIERVNLEDILRN